MNKFKFFSIMAAAAIAFASCKDDDDKATSSSGCNAPTALTGSSDVANNLASNNNIGGNIYGNISLVEDGIYTLESPLIVRSGAIFTIPAGVKIRVGDDSNGDPDGTNRYILVERGATININGTSTKPVVMGDPEYSISGTSEVWGGLIIAGQAPTTKSSCTATGEVANVIYGGNVSNDNSGTINYLVLKGAGAAINSDSEFNGLTLYGVGSGTTISNVAIIGGEDDGVEFFGGTVNASNFYIQDMDDDAIDWTEGWNGTLNNTYVYYTQATGRSTAIEADGSNGNPTISNLTVDMNNTTAVSPAIFQFKSTSGATLTGISVDQGNNTLTDWSFNGTLNTDNIIVLDGVNMTSAVTFNPTYLSSSGYTDNTSQFNWATSATLN